MKQQIKTLYSVESNYELTYERLSDLTDITHFDNAENLYAVRLNITTQKTGFYTNLNIEEWQKIVSKEHLEALLENPTNYKDYEKKFVLSNPISLVTQEYIDYRRDIGFNTNLYEYLHRERLDATQHVSKDYFTDHNNQNYQFIQYIPNRQHFSLWKDVDGEYIIEPFAMSYSEANLDNQTYHLDELISHLSGRSDIRFLLEKDYSSSISFLKTPFNENHGDANRIIHDIPSYNAEENKTESINIIYKPEQKDIEKILQYDNSNRTELYNTKKIFNIETFIVSEVLHCGAFKVNPTPEESIIHKRKFKR